MDLLSRNCASKWKRPWTCPGRAKTIVLPRWVSRSQMRPCVEGWCGGILIDRRGMLGLMLATAAAEALPAGVRAAGSTEGDATRQFSRLLARFADEILNHAPELATARGLDSGARARLKSALDDDSPIADTRWAAQAKSMQARLNEVNLQHLSLRDQLQHATLQYVASGCIAGDKFFYGGAKSAFGFNEMSPYPVSQQDGAILRIPDFLDSRHLIGNAADAEAYLARVAGLARLLDQESARITQFAARGVMPPSFIASNALGQMKDYRQRPVAQQKLLTSLVTRTKAQGIQGDWERRATKIIESQVYPALDRQIAAFAKSTAQAPDTAGVHRLPDGEAYYRWALKVNTTTERSPAEIHAIGVEQNEAIKGQMDALLKSQGMTKGTVGERVQALSNDPSQLFPDTDQGRAAVIDYCNDRLAALRALMPRFSHLQLAAPLIFKRVPIDIQDGAPSAYMSPAPLGNSRPAIYYLNLKSIASWPRLEIPTTTAHEGIPGHAWQFAYLAEHQNEFPLLDQLIGFNAYSEGWALYAEQVVDELGYYANDPFGRLGYLQNQQWRACRLVVDTGIHAMNWTRAQAVQYFASEVGTTQDDSTSEIDRYCAWPGQACGYMMGRNEILRERDRVRAAMGGKFDLAAFNDAVVMSGGVPLSLMDKA